MSDAGEKIDTKARNAAIRADFMAGGVTMQQLAERYHMTKQNISLICVGLSSRARGVDQPPPPVKRERSSTTRQSAGAIARFVAPKAEPERSVGLAADHPAVVEGRTLFPGRVVDYTDTPHLLKSGKNNPKTGDRVLKGPWADMPIFTLTLEERRTCPRTCAVWRECYGNAMQWPARHNAFHPDFMEVLRAEVITLARAHPDGLVVRLHILGDFFSTAYVQMWAELLDLLPQLRVFGYTARRVDDPDPESALIAKALAFLTDNAWDRFAIRTSCVAPGPQRAIVVDEPSQEPMVIMCPAQVEATAACATCGLCWHPAARNKTIGFLRHGIKRASSSAAPNRIRPGGAAAGAPMRGALPGETVEERRERVRAFMEANPAMEPAEASIMLNVPYQVVSQVAARVIEKIERGVVLTFMPRQVFRPSDVKMPPTPEERIASLPEAERRRIEATYGATFKT